MKNLMMCAILGSGLLVGCSDPAITPHNDGSEVTDDIVKPDEVTSDDVGKAIGEAVETTGKFANQKKDEYAAELSQKLEDLDAKLEELNEKAADLGVDAKQKWNEKMEVLREKREAAANQLEKLKSSSADAWTEMQSGMTSAWEELTKAYENAAAELSDDKSYPETDESEE